MWILFFNLALIICLLVFIGKEKDNYKGNKLFKFLEIGSWVIIAMYGVMFIMALFMIFTKFGRKVGIASVCETCQQIKALDSSMNKMGL